MENITLQHGTIAEIANYREQIIPEYSGNPFIEALPEIMDKFEVVDGLSVYPTHNETERNLEAHYRYHLIQRIFQYFQPLPIHIDLESRVSRIVRQGYLARNPFHPQYAEGFNNGYKDIIDNNIELTACYNFRTTASGFTIIGVSGMGKTTAINIILRKIPQIIVHSKYKNKDFNMYQLTWLKLDCPFDGSIKGLCLEFFAKVDSLLATNYFKKYSASRLSANGMLPIMAQIARNTGLGVLVIDEIQHLSLAKSGGADKMLNFFVTLVNTIGIPTILIGTPKALGILQSQFRQARRGSGQGDMVWERLMNDESWKLLIEGLWEYQWTKIKTEINQEFIDALYEESQGIIDIGIKLYGMSQIRAISSGCEEVTIDIIKKVANENFKLVKPMMKALKSGNINKIAKYDDICILDIDGFLNNEYSKISVNSKIKEIQVKNKEAKTLKIEKVKEQAILKLIELDFPEKEVKRHVEMILEDNSEITISEIVKKVLKIIMDKEKADVVNLSTTKRKVNNYSKSDLRYIVKEGKKANIDSYLSLKEAGYIKSVDTICKEVV